MAETSAELEAFLIGIVRPHAAIGSLARDTCCMRPLTHPPPMKLLTCHHTDHNVVGHRDRYDRLSAANG